MTSSEVPFEIQALRRYTSSDSGSNLTPEAQLLEIIKIEIQAL